MIVTFAFAFLVLTLCALLAPVVKHRTRLFYQLFRRTGWSWPLYFVPVSGGLPGTVIGTNPNAGYAGQYSRNGDNITKALPVFSGTGAAAINFGDAVVIIPDATGGTFESAAAFIAGGGTFAMNPNGNITSAFAGFAAREIKQQETLNTFGGAASANNTLGSYPIGVPCDVLVRGSVMAGNFYAKTGNPAPVANGPVFLRKTVNGAGTFVGALETAADGGNTVQLTNCVWTTGVVDTVNGTIEVTITTRNIC